MEMISGNILVSVINKKIKNLFNSLSGSDICYILSTLFFVMSYLYDYNKGWAFIALIFLLISNSTCSK